MVDLADLTDEPSVEDVLAAIGIGRYQILLLFVCGLSLMSVNLEALNMAFVLPLAKCELRFTHTEQGIANAAGFLGLILSAHMWGFLADTWGRQKVLRVALSVALCASVMSSFALNTWMLIGFRFFTGFFISGIQSAAISYLGEFLAAPSRPLFVTLAAVFLPLATAYQPLLANLIMKHEWKWRWSAGFVFAPWRLYILVNTATILLTLPWMMVLPESPKFLMVMGKTDQAIEVLRNVYVRNTQNLPESFPITNLKLEGEVLMRLSDIRSPMEVLQCMWNQTWPLFVQPYRNSMLLIMFVIFSLFFVAHGFYMWMPTVLTIYLTKHVPTETMCQAIQQSNDNKARFDDTAMMPRKAGTDSADPCAYEIDDALYTAMCLMGVGFVILYLLVAFSVKFFGQRYLFSSWIAINSLATLLLIFTTDHALNLFFLMFLSSSASCGSGVAAVSASLFPTQFRGMALCLIMMMCRAGALVGVHVIGHIVFAECTLLFSVFAVIAVVCSVIVWYVFRSRTPT